MNKSELIEKISVDANISKAEAVIVLNSILKNIKSSLNNRNRVSLVGFGSWSVSSRPERQGINPRTGKIITIKAKNVVKFKPSNILNDPDETDDTGPMKNN